MSYWIEKIVFSTVAFLFGVFLCAIGCACLIIAYHLFLLPTIEWRLVGFPVAGLGLFLLGKVYCSIGRVPPAFDEWERDFRG